MFGWFRDFADPEIASIEAVLGLQPVRAVAAVGDWSLSGRTI